MIVAGNWKMNTDLVTARTLARDIVDAIADPGRVTVVLCPPFISLHAVSEVIRNAPVDLGAQNVHHEESGAFTGEISAPMLRSVGCRYVIIGHSERRQDFQESDELIHRKIQTALSYELRPILCVGETLDERKAGREEEVVRRQLSGALQDVVIRDPDHLVIAYEPVWAIGTGETATPEQAQAMHAFIRKCLDDILDASLARATKILYGGSVKPDNASELFENEDVDGGLIGGASLKAADFATIVRAAQ